MKRRFFHRLMVRASLQTLERRRFLSFLSNRINVTIIETKLTNVILNTKNMRLSNNDSFHLSILIFILLFNIFCCSAQTFAPGEIINGHDFSKEVKTFDADRDGDLDVLTFPYLYLNNGKGKKEKVIAIANSKMLYEYYAIEDMDGDKDMDLVVLYKNGVIDIFINELKGFVKKTQKNDVSYTPSEYAKLYLYDANSDGIRDIIVSGLKGVPVAYIGNKSQQFSYFRAFNDQFPKMNVLLGLDVNKDGIEELLVYNYGGDAEGKQSLNVYSFKGTAYVIVATVALMTNGMKNVKLADIDKDGDQDLVYSYGYSDGAIYWIERTAKGGGFGKMNVLVNGLDVEDYQLGDFDSDGDLDIAYFSRKDQYTSLNWAKNSGHNVFIINQPSLLPTMKDSQKFVFEDFDGDKIKDVLFYHDDNEQIRPRYTLILQDKNGLVKEEHTWMTSAKCSGFVFTDIDNNGTKDIVGYYNNELFYLLIGSNGQYAEAQKLAISSFKIENLQCKDLNNDGKEDLIVSNDDRDNGKVGYFKNEGGLQFAPFTIVHEEKERLINFEIIDYNSDGNKDVAVNYWKDNLRGIYIYNNIGNGVYDKNRIVVTEVTNSFPRLALWDVNQDGSEDIIDNGSNSWFKYEGNESWTKQSSPFTELFIKGIYKANLDKDTGLECIMLSSEKLKWLKYNAQNTWEHTIIPVEFGIDMVSVGDINGDYYDDLVCLANTYGVAEGFHEDIAFSYSYSVISLTNDQTGNFVVKTLFPVSNINKLALEDVDNDGDLDILTCSASWLDGGINVWRNTKKK